MDGLSIIVPTYNEEENIKELVERIDKSLTVYSVNYEIIIVDDHSTDNTIQLASNLAENYPIRVFIKKGEKGKTQSLIEGFKQSTYDLLGMIDADLQYEPEALPHMVFKIYKGADVVVADRKYNYSNFFRKSLSFIFRILFVRLLHNISFDSQSGLKVFKKEILERLSNSFEKCNFDLEFLLKAKSAGYNIASEDVLFKKRFKGAKKVNILNIALEIGFNALLLKVHKQVIPFHSAVELDKGKGFHFQGKQFIHHSDLAIAQSAFFRFSAKQTLFLVTLIIIGFYCIWLNWYASLIVLISLVSLLYFTDLIFNMFLIYRSLRKKTEIVVNSEEIEKNDNWPPYTIFCPLYKEWKVLPQFVSAISHLKYPKNKLQVILLVEEDDVDTISYTDSYRLPSYYKTIIVPHSLPKTKPKALNYGLSYAMGEYCVIYDAEDIPDPYQLNKAVLGFRKSPSDIICIQAKLNFYNPHHNLLTRIFTAEYSLWFDLILTGLQSINAPIPLGGTSNHFKTKGLLMIKGWDAFNVTEDCDLGMRLVKKGYKTALINSDTLEEANSDLINWFNQRTRWIKGYIQTYLVHMRNPSEFSTSIKSPHSLTFQLIIGGKILSMFINPAMWCLTFLYFAFRSNLGEFIESLFPPYVFYIAVFSCVFGNFLYLYYYMIGCAKRGYHDLIKYIYLVPFYWLMMSLSAWRSVYQIIVKPHYWNKTVHGFHLTNNKANRQAVDVIGRELVDNNFIGGVSVNYSR